MQRNILRFSRFAILFGSGFTKGEVKSGFTIGPTNMISSSDKDAKLKYVEHTGAAIEAGAKDLSDLEGRMEVLGLQPLVRNSAQSTATGQNIDATNTLTPIQSWIRALELGMTRAYELAALWHKIVLTDDFGIDIFSDFKVTLFNDSDAKLLLESCKLGKLSVETYLREIQRRGKLAESLVIKDEVERIQEQSPNLASLFEPDEDDDEEDGDEEDDGEGS